jgi:hypothetical protein
MDNIRTKPGKAEQSAARVWGRAKDNAALLDRLQISDQSGWQGAYLITEAHKEHMEQRVSQATLSTILDDNKA